MASYNCVTAPRAHLDTTTRNFLSNLERRAWNLDLCIGFSSWPAHEPEPPLSMRLPPERRAPALRIGVWTLSPGLAERDNYGSRGLKRLGPTERGQKYDPASPSDG